MSECREEFEKHFTGLSIPGAWLDWQAAWNAAMARAAETKKKNDERWQWLRENGVYLIECVIERRGYRSTAVDAQWEVWHERDGWITSAHHNYQEPFQTMDDAVDDAMEKKDAE